MLHSVFSSRVEKNNGYRRELFRAAVLLIPRSVQYSPLSFSPFHSLGLSTGGFFGCGVVDLGHRICLQNKNPARPIKARHAMSTSCAPPGWFAGTALLIGYRGFQRLKTPSSGTCSLCIDETGTKSRFSRCHRICWAPLYLVPSPSQAIIVTGT